MLLSKPFVEDDHSVSVIQPDKSGISYLCSDCGAWPGGRVSLTWKQWDTMSASVAAVVMRDDLSGKSPRF